MAPQLPSSLFLVALLLAGAGLAAADSDGMCFSYTSWDGTNLNIQGYQQVPCTSASKGSSISQALVFNGGDPVTSTCKTVTNAAQNSNVCTGQCSSDVCPAVSCKAVKVAGSETLGDCVCPISNACGDPHFQGGQGVTFDFQGWPDHEYALISDQDFQLSAHMIGQEFADTGVTGTWMSRLGFMYNFEGKTNRVEVALKEVDNTVTDTLVLLVNGLVVDLPTAEYTAADIGLTLSAWNPETKSLMIHVASYLVAELSVVEHQFPDGFNLDFAIFHLKTTASIHGVLGQTFSPNRVYHLASLLADMKAGSKESYTGADVIEGAEGDYELSDLFATDFAYTRFSAPSTGLSLRKLLGSSAVTEVPYVIRSDGSAMNIAQA